MVIDAGSGNPCDARFADLPKFIHKGDVVVINDAATLPASLQGTTRGAAVELRLLSFGNQEAFEAVLFGDGDWRTRTEQRAAPPNLKPGDKIDLGSLTAIVEWTDGTRRARIRFDGVERDALWAQLLRIGRPVQYAHLDRPLAPWDVQTLFATRPWSMELASAAFPLTFALLQTLRSNGVIVVPLTHGCGLSSTGDLALDAELPWPERYEIPPATAEAVNQARSERKDVIAIGTSVTRALESAALTGAVRAGPSVATLRIGPQHRLRAVDAIVSGLHDSSESHFQLLRAFAPEATLLRAWEHAERAGYLGHEYGDLCLLERQVLSARQGTRFAVEGCRG